MKKSVKVKWVKALRSNKYRQTVGHLKNSEGYCCLGVLRTLMPEPLNKGEQEKNNLLNRQQLAWAGLHHSSQDGLAIKNDEWGWSFKEIADYIEKRL